MRSWRCFLCGLRICTIGAELRVLIEAECGAGGIFCAECGVWRIYFVRSADLKIIFFAEVRVFFGSA